MSAKILVLPGDYIGPEIMAEAEKVLAVVDQRFGLDLEIEHGLLGGAALDVHGVPLPEEQEPPILSLMHVRQLLSYAFLLHP